MGNKSVYVDTIGTGATRTRIEKGSCVRQSHGFTTRRRHTNAERSHTWRGGKECWKCGLKYTEIVQKQPDKPPTFTAGDWIPSCAEVLRRGPAGRVVKRIPSQRKASRGRVGGSLRRRARIAGLSRQQMAKIIIRAGRNR
jgi:hypothetical protein